MSLDTQPLLYFPIHPSLSLSDCLSTSLSSILFHLLKLYKHGTWHIEILFLLHNWILISNIPLFLLLGTHFRFEDEFCVL
ncbi:hypothetical protein L1887_01185 [Cichorium endivia]|nr:hypothetical protein L1887_01185 [Cichorium endivia]